MWLSSFLLPSSWNADVMSGAPAAILDHEVGVTLGMEATHNGATR